MAYAIGDFTEFYVTQGASTSDTNGGGPRLGTDDGATYTLAAGANGATATDNGADSNIEDLNNGSWGDTQVDDWLCFDTGGLKEFARVIAIDVGADTDVITVSPQVTAAAEKGCKVCGAWATLQHAADTVTTSFVNSDGAPPRTNLKYEASSYTGAGNEEVDFDTNAGTVAIPLTFEGYYSTAGDEGDNSGTWTIPHCEGPAGASKDGTFTIAAAIDFLRFRHIKITAQTNLKDAISTSCDNGLFECLHLKATGTVADGITDAGFGNVIRDCWIEDYTNRGIYADFRTIIEGCYIESASGGLYGIYLSAAYAVVRNCIINTCATDCITVTSDNCKVIDCSLYNCTGGSGVYLTAAHDNTLVTGNICDTMNQYGIESAANCWIEESYNSFRSCTQGTHDSNIFSDPVGNTTHSGDPWTNTGGNDFSLDNTAGQGAALRNAGWPGALRAGGTGYADIGALRHQDASSGGMLKGEMMGGMQLA